MSSRAHPFVHQSNVNLSMLAITVLFYKLATLSWLFKLLQTHLQNNHYAVQLSAIAFWCFIVSQKPSLEIYRPSSTILQASLCLSHFDLGRHPRSPIETHCIIKRYGGH